jgi:UDP-N-acetylglucosamine 2-epimerase (non-hydrolysing)
MEKRVLLIVGTRPEAIKLIPLYTFLKQASFDAILCATNQHTDLLIQACAIFDVVPDINLNVMQDDQDLFHITQTVLVKLKTVYNNLNPDLVIVQGDTTTAFSAALAAFYCKIPVAHVEAGLRSGDKFAPYPEEINRKLLPN